MSASICTRYVLARGTVSQVDFCTDCGVFHVSFESVTVRFAPTALRDLSETLAAALANFQEAQRRETEPADGRQVLQ